VDFSESDWFFVSLDEPTNIPRKKNFELRTTFQLQFLVAGLEFQLEFGRRLSTFPTRAFKGYIIGMTGLRLEFFGAISMHVPETTTLMRA
jgi:hypothetical protein